MTSLLRGHHAVVFAGLVLLMAATRFHHVGSLLQLSDASLIVFLLAGACLPALALPLLLLEAVAIDLLVIALSGLRGGPLDLGLCVTTAYALLPLAYVALWLAGRLIARRGMATAGHLLQAALIWWLAVSAAFVISDGSYYLFSGFFDAPQWSEYLMRVQQFYRPYVSRELPWAVLAGMAALGWQWYRRAGKVILTTGSR